jgi:hypothetical protein
MQLAQYDTVRVVGLHKAVNFERDACNHRAPRIGDIACIIEVYSEPVGYELECSAANGETEWLLSFSLSDIELELVK